ncbi:hypothetical protein NFX39_02345 [Fructobacillus sp. W13]|uniref:Uncharacterized protein n=1 Tax=Fructobacillus apis TaxID=2935017 RepID=A0ABT0ZPK4_9LACO|nr:hypothetical protein [Fructobacillus apis]MCO0831936.1 hypothetical protein [Fructobacillus apis]
MNKGISHSKKFEKYIEKTYLDQVVYKFSNGYGASVVFHFGSYGYENGLCEIAVLKFDDNGRYDICYTTPITEDVIGYADDKTRDEVLKQIKELPK